MREKKSSNFTNNGTRCYNFVSELEVSGAEVYEERSE